MRLNRFTQVAVVAFLALLVAPKGLEGQAVAKLDRFDSSEACLAALQSGNFQYYVPSFLKPVPVGRGEVRRPLEDDACVHLWIVGRWAWVPQAAGTMYDFSGPTPIRRVDCGNRVKGIVYPAQERVAEFIAPSPRPSVVYTPPPAPRPQPRPQMVVQKRRNYWPLIGVAAVAAGACAVWCRASSKSTSRASSSSN